MQTGILSEEELLAVRFYMGDPEVAENGPYEGGPEAYNTINALLHPGSANEQDKAREGRVIMLTGVNHLKSYLRLIELVYHAMEKYRRYRLENDTASVTFRLDRLSSLQRFEADHHRVSGFFSTCKRGFLPEYAHKKADIVMLETERDSSVPFLDFEDIFADCYAKPEEAEILLPFGMYIDQMTPLPLSEEECTQYHDINGQPPVGKWRLHMTMDQWPQMDGEKRQQLYQLVTDEKTVSRAMACMDRLTAGKVLADDEEVFYETWKVQLQQYIMSMLEPLR